MKKYILILMAVLVLGLPGGVRAAEVETLNPESRWFGITWAFEKVKHNFEVWTARTEEKKAELEIKFVEKEQRLTEKIAELEKTNPEAAERLGKVADKLKQKRTEKIEKIEMRIQKMEEKGEGKVEQIRERKEKILQRRPEGLERVEDGQDDEEMGETMEGKGVKIQNAKPGVVRMR